MSDQETVVVERRVSRPLVIALVAVLALALLAAIWFFAVTPLLLGDDAGDDAAAVETVTPVEDEEDEEVAVPDVSPSPVVPGDDGELALPVETYEVFLSRDPFRPVRPAAAPTGGTTGGTTTGGVTTGGTTTGATTTGGTTTGGTTTGATTGGATTGGTTTGGATTGGTTGGTTGDGTATVDGREVVLVDVFEENGEQRAVVQVDGTAFEVGRGDRFADNFQVLSIDPPCVSLLFGDDSFTLCEGERVLK